MPLPSSYGIALGWPLAPGQAVLALRIVGDPTTTGTVDTPIAAFQVNAYGGAGGYEYALVGDYPPGAGVDTDGLVTPGEASEAHTYTGLSVSATDADGSVVELPTFQIDVSAAPADYTCGAVDYDGATDMHIASFTATDGGFVSFNVWLLAAWTGLSGATIFANDPDTLGGGFYLGSPAGGAGNQWFCVDVTDVVRCKQASLPADNVWVNYIGTAQTDVGGGGNIIKLFRNRVDVTASVVDSGAAFSDLFNGRPFYIGNDNAGDFYTGSMADPWIAPNQSLLTGTTIASGTLDKFITAGLKPVDLGGDGSAPTGTPPAFFGHIAHGGTPSDMALDRSGNGNDMTIGGGVTQAGALVNTSADVVMADVTGITVGAFITVAGVPAGTTVLSIDTLTVTMSAPATASNPTASIKFGGVLRLAPSSPSD